jgi:hypothetical protein
MGPQAEVGYTFSKSQPEKFCPTLRTGLEPRLADVAETACSDG